MQGEHWKDASARPGLSLSLCGSAGTEQGGTRQVSGNGVDHPNGHGVGHAELVTDFRVLNFCFCTRLPPPGVLHDARALAQDGSWIRFRRSLPVFRVE
jgi:hypothetical protein